MLLIDYIVLTGESPEKVNGRLEELREVLGNND